MLNASQQTELECGDRHVFQHAARLVGNPLGIDGADVVDTHRVLYGHCGDDRQRMTAHARKRHDVRLKPGPSAGIRSGEHQHYGREIRHEQGITNDRALCCQRSDSLESDFSPKTDARMTDAEAKVYKTYMCLICGFVYDEAAGLPDEGIPAGTRWEDVPMNWTCPECGARKEDFELVEI